MGSGAEPGHAALGRHLVWSPLLPALPCLPMGGGAHVSPGPPLNGSPLKAGTWGALAPYSTCHRWAGPPKDTAMAPRGRRTELSGAVWHGLAERALKVGKRGMGSRPCGSQLRHGCPQCVLGRWSGRYTRWVLQARSGRGGRGSRSGERHWGAPFRGFLGGRFETPEGSPAQRQAFPIR